MLLFLLLLLNLFQGMEARRKTMEPQNPGNHPGTGPDFAERERDIKVQAI